MLQNAFNLTAIDLETRYQLEQALSEVGDPTKLLETQLGIATMNALTSDKLTPLIKEELRWSIQAKRLESGQSELEPEQENRKEEKLTEEEILKREDKKRRNCLAARRCRNRKKEKGDQLEHEVSLLLAAQRELDEQVALLHQEKDELMALLHRHDTTATCGEKMTPQSEEMDESP